MNSTKMSNNCEQNLDSNLKIRLECESLLAQEDSMRVLQEFESLQDDYVDAEPNFSADN